MKKIFSALFVLIALNCGFAKSGPPVPPSYSVSQTGPAVVIPGLDPPMGHFQGAVGTVVWKHFASGSVIGTGVDIAITQGDINYDGFDRKPPSNCPPLEVCDVQDFFGGTVNVPSLSHTLSIDHGLSGSGTSKITLTTNADQYKYAVEWFRNGVSLGGGTAIMNVLMPGVYSAKVTYTYNNKFSTLSVSNSITVAPSPLAPVLSTPALTYNPVIQPVISVSNAAQFGNFVVLLNGSQILFQTRCAGCGPISFTVTAPGTYQVGAFTTNGAEQFTDDIVVPNGALPEPTIVSSSPKLTYEAPQLTLTVNAGSNTTANYGNGYQWYFNNNPIPTATQKSIFVFKPGEYKVNACAQYPDGSISCRMSNVFVLTGETVRVSFVRTKTPLIPKTSPTDVNALQFTDMMTSTGFFDGLARPIEQVVKGASPAGHDVININQYDAFGRERKKFLPFARTTADGSFLVMPLSLLPLTSFYSDDNDHVADTSVPFAETAFENSPLNRPLQEGSAGEEWQINNNHARSFKYTTNATTDKVFIWARTQTGVSASSFYAAGTLGIVETTDEDGNISREYKDKNGRVILTERTIESGVKLRTYYTFDDIGRLQFVLPPNTISNLPNTASVSIASDVLARECYSYQYDERNRTSVKNIPGAGATYLIYDKWDRLVLSQSANQRLAGKWIFNKYDGLDRIIMTGEILLAGDYTAIRQTVDTFYATVQSNQSLRFEETGGSIHGYTNRSFPVLANQFQAFVISYYDNYTFLSQFGTGYNFSLESIGMTSNSTIARSLTTGSKVLILGGQTYLKTVNYYDSKHRKIQTVSDNHQGGIDRVSLALDFVGKVMKSRESHNGLQPVKVDQEFSYDHQGRSLRSYHTINDGTKVLLSDKKYNEAGQMIEQNIHSTDGNTFLQSQDYIYNIRGWLSQVNPVETESNVQFQDQYGYELSYTTPPVINNLTGFQPAFNGNITAFTEIRPGSTNLNNEIFKNGFSYRYDQRNQLTQANYFQVAGPVQTPTNTFNMPAITYDPNGNIKSLTRMGVLSNGSTGTVDQLSYDYNGNQLRSVTDGGDHSKGFIKK